jgi:hypothetical protein
VYKESDQHRVSDVTCTVNMMIQIQQLIYILMQHQRQKKGGHRKRGSMGNFQVMSKTEAYKAHEHTTARHSQIKEPQFESSYKNDFFHTFAPTC